MILTLIHSADDTKMHARAKVKALIDKYAQIASDQKRYKNYNEEETKKKFIEPLFEALGWDLEIMDEVSLEENVSKGRVDYGFRINGIPKFFLEAKRLRENLDDVRFIKQTIDYSWNKACTWAVLTDFEGIKIFNAEVCSDDYYQHQFMEIKWTEFLDRFEELWLLSKEAFELGLLDKVAEKWGKKFRRIHIDKQLLDDITMFRAMLSANITHLNKSRKLTKENLDEAVQRILNRLIFIRYCEDKELEERQLISHLRRGETKGRVIQHIRGLFKYYGRYNSKIFAPHFCDDLDIDNDVLHDIIDGLYHPKDAPFVYDFSAIESDVLGNIYEQYLGHILQKTNKRAKLTASTAKRKQKGIYYTPSHIVDYIVRNTVGKLLEDKKVNPEKIRILDLAYGSGSFLIKAFDILSDYYIKHDKNYAQTRLDMGGQGMRYAKRLGILQNNIFGVDLDKQAVEIAELNLFLKIAERGRRLPLLDENIKQGNSLIDSSLLAEDRALNWKEEFPKIMKEGGFDVIIGNPPYERTLYLEGEKEYYSRNYESAYGGYDILVLFIERAIKLLRDNGLLGFIVSNKFLISDYGTKLRKFILSNAKIVSIMDLADAKRVFPDALVSTVIIILQKKTVNSNYNIRRFVADKNTTSFDESKFDEIPLEKFVANNGTFNVRYDARNNSIYQKINRLQKFGEIFDIRTGVMGFEYWKMEPLMHEDKKKYTDIRIVTNSHLDRYCFLYGKKINLYKKHFEEPYADIEKLPVNDNTKKLFLTKNKLIVRGVSKRLTAMIDEQGVGFLVAVHSIITKEGYDPKFVLGIMNSKFFDWIHKDRYYLGRIPEGSLKYPISFMKDLPVPNDVTESEEEALISLVEKIITLNKRLGQFNDKMTDERMKIEREIKKVDNQIDEIVYDIYNITDDEKKVIEQSVYS